MPILKQNFISSFPSRKWGTSCFSKANLRSGLYIIASLLLVKLDAYGFTKQALKHIECYLRDRKLRVKSNGSYSERKSINNEVPQGSVLSPSLFNIYINDLFMFVSDSMICNYDDDTTIYASD